MSSWVSGRRIYGGLRAQQAGWFSPEKSMPDINRKRAFGIRKVPEPDFKEVVEQTIYGVHFTRATMISMSIPQADCLW